MKKIVKRAIKLIEFLIRVLFKAVKTGTKYLEDIQKVAEKSEKLAPILLEVAAIISQLEQKKQQLEKIVED